MGRPSLIFLFIQEKLESQPTSREAEVHHQFSVKQSIKTEVEARLGF